MYSFVYSKKYITMKYVTCITMILFFTTGLVHAQLTDSMLKSTKIKFKEIRKNLTTYDTVRVDESTDGGEGIAYYDKGELKLIQMIWFGETGKTQMEYYFDAGKLFFVFEQVFSYNRPIYWDKKTAKENNDDEFFDLSKSTIKENRYYFNNDKLGLWLDNDKAKVDLSLEENSNVGKDLIIDAYQIKDKLKK